MDRDDSSDVMAIVEGRMDEIEDPERHNTTEEVADYFDIDPSSE